MKQYYIIILLNKNDHLKYMLNFVFFLVADGTFDGIYSRRFMGLTKKSKSSSTGYVLPPGDVQDNIAARCVDRGNNLFEVPSKTTEGKFYIVDMTIGSCECKVT